MITTAAVNSPRVAASQVRILVADDHEVMRLGIRNLLEAHTPWVVCAEAQNGYEAVAKAVEFHPDVIIMDITMPAMNGLEAATHLDRSGLNIPVILFSLHAAESFTDLRSWNSIRGAVNKSNAARDLIEAIEAVLRGGTFFSNANPAPSASRINPT